MSGNPQAPDELYLEILDRMESEGGSFVSALATAWKRADPGNRIILHAAFSTYFDLYAVRVCSERRRREAIIGEAPKPPG